jgi:hypothetical protein
VLEDVELARLGALARVLPVAVKMLVAVQLARPEVGAARSGRRARVQNVDCIALPRAAAGISPGAGRGRRRERGRSRVDGAEPAGKVAAALVLLACPIV